MMHKASPEEMMQRGIDEDLSPQERADLDDYLARHPEDAAAFAQMQRQTALIARAIPTPSQEHLQGLRRRAEQAAAPGPGRKLGYRIAASAAIFAVGLGMGFGLGRPGAGAETDLTRFAESARAAHALYVGEVLHPVEVAATQRDHLQTWLSNRLGAPIIAPVLGDTGFQLIGGRLLPAGEQAAALFMYENEDGDRLSLLATHGASGPSHSFKFHEEVGSLTIYWQDGPWKYSLVGALAREPMDQIAREIHGQLI